MTYNRIFDPGLIQVRGPEEGSAAIEHGGDLRDGSVYVYKEEIILAVNVALVTNRPLLIRGPSGSGKSTLAHSVARLRGWRYYEEVISSRTQARDLLWHYDQLRRLNDAQIHELKQEAAYIDPGVFWWAFDREGARRRGVEGKLDFPESVEPGNRVDHEQAVVLLDEIDKADPDVPNNLLVPLGSLQFVVQETNTLVKANCPPLLFITTNDERELPVAFLRRCVILVLKSPNEQELVSIACAHFGEQHMTVYKKIASLTVKAAQKDQKSGQIAVSAAEYLDAVRACRRLEIDPEAEDWETLSKFTLWKERGPLGGL
jgi:MoxR-like ATPase